MGSRRGLGGGCGGWAGGESDARDRHRAKGKLLTRDRVERLLDPGYGGRVGAQTIAAPRG